MKNIWCDRMVCDGDRAWMTGANFNALFSLDFNTKTYEFISDFPSVPIMDYRVNLVCMKVKDELFFFPDWGKCIWIYHMASKTFGKIILNNPKGVRVLIGMVFYCNHCIYAFSNGLEQIIEISVSQKEVIGVYSISEYIQESGITRISSEGCVVNENIYFTIPEKNLVCEFSTKTKTILGFPLDGNIVPQTIRHDGENFWMTGKTKEIMKWNKEKNKVISVYPFPAVVGWFESRNGAFLEDIEGERCPVPMFRWSVKVKDKIWFIPYVANKIIYIDKNTCEIGICDIMGEYEDEKSWNRAEKVKYCFECIVRERFIFLYSYKNRRYLLIDTITNAAQMVDIELTEESSKKLFRFIRENRECMMECNNIKVFDMLWNFDKNEGENAVHFGKYIWEKLSEERV